MAPWNLGLRFGLEVAALVGLARGSRSLASGSWVAASASVILAAIAWAVFNVPRDPSRSGRAHVEVAGSTRLALELVVLGGGVAGFIAYGPATVGIVMAALLSVHYIASGRRLRWLLNQRGQGRHVGDVT